MSENNKKLTRRSLLQAAGAGTGAALLGSALPRQLYAQAAGDVDKAIAWAKANLPNSTPEIVTGAAKEGKLVLLLQTSGTDEAMVGMMKKFKEHYPFIDVSYTLQNTVQVMNRFTSEVNAKKGVTDVLMLPSNLSETNNYITAGNVANFVISQDAAFPEGTKRSGLWYAWATECTATVYRKGALSDEEKKLIRTFKGLSDPRFKGRLGVNGVTNSVSVTGSYVLQNNPDKSLWDGLTANKPQVKPASPALMDGLLSGQYDVSLFASYASAATAAKSGAPIEFGNTALVPTLYIPGAISAIAPNPNAARLWQDWAMSKEGQDIWVNLVGAFSARNDTVAPWAKQQPWFFDDPASHKPIDWTDFTAKQAAVVEKYKKDFQAG